MIAQQDDDCLCGAFWCYMDTLDSAPALEGL